MKNLQISLEDFVTLQKLGEDFIVVDVREPWEIEKAPFKDALNIPLGKLSSQISDIPDTSLIITLCHHGVRSLKASYLLDLAQRRSLSLKGGIEDYALSVDPTIVRY
ncbi:MAG: hypothetical protein B7Y25_01240 [Alphaproteobacteria bacterium 16-39-46]|nr:MAG: hypothetical protein B7Y25_01240 [Alphaproteobacteria bacterium 16-39-46]OZA44134.1 MAG: hypothetical protein B7X84_01240 [Alphaproteobacteria bacterium 17-39-52]HQS83521.1 sulfurtransferase [Alphaproteobacteria bacterium]HQS93289.1 sulfurtransferase [Alphaproteobacteria bacterium]